MVDADKREFFDVLVNVGSLYDQTSEQVRKKSPIYWEALNHRALNDIKAALNAHVRDPERGRFFPKPADIEHQLSGTDACWLDAEVAWAMCPKDEDSSAAMCDEMARALAIASDLISSGDMVAARMAFKAAYNRIIDEAKSLGKKPRWFASLGHDKDGRHHAEVKAVELNNALLPPDQRKALPKPEGEPIGIDALLLNAPECSKEVAVKHLQELKAKIGKA